MICAECQKNLPLEYFVQGNLVSKLCKDCRKVAFDKLVDKYTNRRSDQ